MWIVISFYLWCFAYFPNIYSYIFLLFFKKLLLEFVTCLEMLSRHVDYDKIIPCYNPMTWSFYFHVLIFYSFGTYFIPGRILQKYNFIFFLRATHLLHNYLWKNPLFHTAMNEWFLIYYICVWLFPYSVVF
jgi:hypothetical protein